MILRLQTIFHKLRIYLIHITCQKSLTLPYGKFTFLHTHSRRAESLKLRHCRAKKWKITTETQRTRRGKEESQKACERVYEEAGRNQSQSLNQLFCEASIEGRGT